MRQAFSILSVALLSCGHRFENSLVYKTEYNNRRSQRLDTLIAKAYSCTECLDLYIEKGNLTIPNDLKVFKIDSFRDIKVCGNFPMDLLDVTTFNFEYDLTFKIVGKVIMADANNGIGAVPLFYVDDYEKILLDR